MTLSELKKLKSGTDVRGTAVGEGALLSDEAVTDIIKAFAVWTAKKLKKEELTIAVGHDPRVSAQHISSLVCAALISSGVNVVFCGLSTTPSMFILLKESDFGCDASVMITASHLPADKNGLKFFTPEGGLDGEDIDQVLFLASEKISSAGAGKYSERSFMDEYSRILLCKDEKACGYMPLKEKKIIVDAGNGAGGFFAGKVLEKLGADVTGSICLEPDGAFPVHIPNPEDGSAVAHLKRAVKESGADLGIIFDADVDRAACVDGDGNGITRNSLVALAAAIVLPERGGVIVTDSATSVHLTEFIEGLGGKHLRYKRGYRNVIDKCRELNERGEYSPLAIETSGHAAFPENYYLDDGAYLITKILISLAALSKEGKSLSSLIEGLKRPAEEAEARLRFNAESVDFKKEGEKVIADLTAAAAADPSLALSEDSFEGVRFTSDCGTTLVRMSVHDPVMPVNFESDVPGGVKRAAEKLRTLLEGYPFLDCGALDNIISEPKEKL